MLFLIFISYFFPNKTIIFNKCHIRLRTYNNNCIFLRLQKNAFFNLLKVTLRCVLLDIKHFIFIFFFCLNMSNVERKKYNLFRAETDKKAYVIDVHTL